jgi:hypothetical protein
MLLSGSPYRANLVLLGPEPIDTPTPRQLGAAYRQVEAIQRETLLALGDDYRRVQAAAAQLADRANHAIARDRRIVQAGADIASLAEGGLDIAQGVEDRAASNDKIYIPNGLYPSGLGKLVQAAHGLSQELTYAAGRSTDAVIHKLNSLCKQLSSDAAPRG